MDAAYFPNGQGTAAANPKEVSWCKPPPRHYKLNMDAAYFLNCQGTAAAVIQNDCGQAIAGGVWTLMNILDASTAEALALRYGLTLLKDIGCSPTIVESDNLELMNDCNGTDEIWTP
jgi:hypothetical protein